MYKEYSHQEQRQMAAPHLTKETKKMLYVNYIGFISITINLITLHRNYQK